MPGTDASSFTMADKVAHITLYFPVGLLACSAFFLRQKWPKAALTLFAGASFAALDELHQLFIPGRSCSFYDFLADLTGIALGIVACILITSLSIRSQSAKIKTGSNND